MTNLNTKITKGFHGLSAETILAMGTTGPQGLPQELHITTMKRSSGQVMTISKVVERTSDGCVTFIIFQDYQKTVKQGAISRITEKSLSAFHSEALMNVETYMQDAKAFYLKQAA
jgi:hypothetical protein